MTRTVTEYYELRRVKITRGADTIAPAAMLDCGLCGRNIDSSGGPGHGVICRPCGDALKRGELRGAVKYKEGPNP